MTEMNGAGKENESTGTEKSPKRPRANLAPWKESVREILNSTQAFIEKTRIIDRNLADSLLTIIWRTVLHRQFVSLETILHMVNQEKGFITGSLLRQTCEEFIWIKYLSGMHPDHAEQLIETMSKEEVCGLLVAQDKSMGSGETEKLGLSPYLKKMRETKGLRRDSFCELAKKLKWPKPETGNIPPVSWLAKKVDEKQIYDLIYHSTSRFVHFSPFELMRLVRSPDRAGDLLIRPDSLNLYRSAFSLCWGACLFAYTIEEVFKSPNMLKQDDGLAREINLHYVKELVEGMGGTPPIIGIWEVAPPEHWQD